MRDGPSGSSSDVPHVLEAELLIRLGQLAIQLDQIHTTSHDRTCSGKLPAVVPRHVPRAPGRPDDIARQLFPITIAMADRAKHGCPRSRGRNATRPGHFRHRTSAGHDGTQRLRTADVAGERRRHLAHCPRPLGQRPLGRYRARARASYRVLSLQENLFAITTGGVGRAKTGAAELMAKGIADSDDTWGEPPAPASETATRGVFAPDGPSIQPELADLFIVEYLAHRPDLVALDIPTGRRGCGTPSTATPARCRRKPRGRETE